MSTASPIVAVMDADRQHDERILGRMFDILNTSDADIVVGSRYIAGARGKGEVTTGTNHLGFRCVRDSKSGHAIAGSPGAVAPAASLWSTPSAAGVPTYSSSYTAR